MCCAVFTFAWHSVCVLGQISPYLLSHIHVITNMWPSDDEWQWELQLVISVIVWSILCWFNQKKATWNNKVFIKKHSDCQWLMIERLGLLPLLCGQQYLPYMSLICKTRDLQSSSHLGHNQTSTYNPPGYSIGRHVFFSRNLSGLSGGRWYY